MHDFFSIVLSGSFLTILLLISLVIIMHTSKRMDVEGIQLMRVFMIMVLIISLIESFEGYVIQKNYDVHYRIIKTALIYCMYPMLPVLQVLIVDKEKKKHLYILIPQIINIVLCVLDIFGVGIIFSFKGGLYDGGPLRSLPLILVCCYMVVLFLISYRLVKSGEKSRAYIIMFMVIMVLVNTLLEFLNIVSGLTDEVAALSMLIYYYYLSSIYYSEIQEKVYQQELELSKNNVKLLIAQIQPHFIYNSLYSIKSLCRQNPEKAAVLVQDFSEYLRANFDSLSSEKMIPFTQELSHIRKYISLEKANPRLEAEIKWELQIKDFELPALSIEPLVENAIRHGVGSRVGGGVVTIGSFEDDSNIYITVEDNGRGIDNSLPEQRKRKGVGLENVRKRLKVECDGTIDVQSSPTGTKVTVAIPKKTKED